eukprot:TRINITY_DN2849_c0_g1_i10.p1 TRINITY_DN2849_c0_g1~~TRINITY_DN2849_c0_g1_i10.p1  ORF type:complete len:186 (-),score=-14.35 TRINITY_DN2849_c0_g1_i10:445-1002(-)
MFIIQILFSNVTKIQRSNQKLCEICANEKNSTKNVQSIICFSSKQIFTVKFLCAFGKFSYVVCKQKKLSINFLNSTILVDHQPQKQSNFKYFLSIILFQLNSQFQLIQTMVSKTRLYLFSCDSLLYDIQNFQSTFKYQLIYSFKKKIIIICKIEISSFSSIINIINMNLNQFLYVKKNNSNKSYI